MITIHLKDLEFFSHHGVYEQEKILGNCFIVNASVCFNADEKINSIHQTINYVSIYQLIKHRMQIPTALLETLAQEMTEEIYSFDNRLQSISISIQKKYPPMLNIKGSVCVNYEKKFS